MKKTLLLLTLALTAACLLVASCSSANGPEAVAKTAITALQKGDYDAYAATFNLSSSDQKMLAGLAEEKIDEQIAKKGGIKSFKIMESSVNEDKAKVKVHLIYKDGSEEDQDMSFAKVDNEWKQEMDK